MAERHYRPPAFARSKHRDGENPQGEAGRPEAGSRREWRGEPTWPPHGVPSPPERPATAIERWGPMENPRIMASRGLEAERVPEPGPAPEPVPEAGEEAAASVPAADEPPVQAGYEPPEGAAPPRPRLPVRGGGLFRHRRASEGARMPDDDRPAHEQPIEDFRFQPRPVGRRPAVAPPVPVPGLAETPDQPFEPAGGQRFMHIVAEDPPRRRIGLKPILITLIVLVTFGGFGGVVWLAYRQAMGLDETPALIRAEEGGYKEPPESPGGLDLANEDSSVARVFSQAESEPRVEQILPRPEGGPRSVAQAAPELVIPATETAPAAETQAAAAPDQGTAQPAAPTAGSPVAEAAPVDPANAPAADNAPSVAPAAEDAPGAPQVADGVPSAQVAAEDAPGAVPAAADAPIPPQTDETAAADDDAAPPVTAEPATAPAAETPVPASEGTALAANPAALPANEDVGGQAPLDRPAEPAIEVEREAGPLATVTIERHPVLPDGTAGTDPVPPTATGAVPAREPAATASSAPGTAPRVLSPIFSRADSAPATARPPAETRTAALEPAATPPAAAEPPAASASGAVWRVQLAALGSRPAAESAWRALRGRHPEILGSLPVNYQEYDSGQATLVRVQAGSFADRAAAGRACAALRSAGTDCFVVGGGR